MLKNGSYFTDYSTLSNSGNSFYQSVNKGYMQYDYYPFGMLQPGRSYSAAGGYRYGFNGKENDNEVKGVGGQQDYGMRIYDPRLGKFLSVDPISMEYPWYSPYHFGGNNPISFIDLDGEEPSKPKIDYVTKYQIAAASMSITANEILSYQSIRTLTTSKSIQNKIDEKLTTLRKNYAYGMEWMYKNRSNLAMDKKNRVESGLGIMATGGLIIGGTALSVYGISSSATLVVDAFEYGGVSAGVSALATEFVQFQLMQLTAVPIPINLKLGKGFGGANFKGAINFLKGQLKNYADRGYDLNKTISQLNKSIKSLNKTIDEHIEKINDPVKWAQKEGLNWNKLSTQEQKGYLNKWNNDIKRNSANKQVLEEAKNMLQKIK